MIRSSLLRTIAPSILLTLAGFLLAYQFVDPAPPRELTLGTGDKMGAYYLFGQRYREILEREGVRVTLLATAGSVDNLALLTQAQDPIDAAFVQGGSGLQKTDHGLHSLGSLYYEPLWVFYRGDNPMGRLTQLRGMRLAIGKDGSGTQELVRQLLSLNGLDETNSELHALDDETAVEHLSDGRLEAMFLVAAANSPLVRRALSVSGIHLMNFERAAAYTRNLRFLSHVVLPEGAIDLEKNIPPQDTQLLAATANLVVGEDMHPALIDLILQAAQEVHDQGGWFEKSGEFPSREQLVFPLNPDARRFYQFGPPLLQRILPFWVASFIDRMKVMLLPLIALLIPLLKVMPPVYRWRMRSRVYRWYRELQTIDLATFHRDADRVEYYQAELRRIEREVAKVDIPLSFADELFNLRLHIELIRRRLREYQTGQSSISTQASSSQQTG